MKGKGYWARLTRIHYEMQRDPHCSDCGVIVRWVEAKRHAPMPPDAACLARPFAKDSRRQGVRELVCFACSCERGRRQDAARPIEELRWRSGYYDEGHRLNRRGDPHEDRRVRSM